MAFLGLRFLGSLNVVLSISLVSACVWADSPSPNDLDWLRGECDDGALVHHAAGKLYLTELSTGRSEFLAVGRMPEFSPDGARIAWIDGTVAKGRLRAGDPTVHVLADRVELGGGVHWASWDAVLVVRRFGADKRWVRVSLDGETSPFPVLTALGTGGYECDVRRCADGVWSYVAKTSWATSDGKRGTVPGTCSVSLSPDGRSVTSLHNPHKECTISAVREGGISRTVYWKYRGGFDNQRWASSDARFIVCVDEHHRTMVVMTADGSRCTRMGTLGKAKHGMYGDFVVGAPPLIRWHEKKSEREVDSRDGATSWPSVSKGLLFLWENDVASNTIQDVGGEPALCRLLPAGRAMVNRTFGLRLDGGFCEADGESNQRIFCGVKRAGRIAIELVLTPPVAPLEDGAAADVLGLGSVGSEPMISLLERDGTYEVSVVGTAGEVARATARDLPRRSHHLVVVIDGRKVLCFIDGKKVAESLSGGEFGSCFEFGPLVLGNRNHGWAGVVEAVAIYDRALAEREIQRNAAVWTGRLAERSEPRRWEIEATLRTKTPSPQATVYPNTLVVFEYLVAPTSRAAIGTEKIAVAHWGSLNGVEQAAVGRRKIGEAYRLRLEEFDLHPELATRRILWGDVQIDLPLFYSEMSSR